MFINYVILHYLNIIQARAERANALGGLGAYGDDEDLDEPENEKDYYRTTVKSVQRGNNNGNEEEDGDGETHYHSGGGGAAKTAGSYGKELGGKIEQLGSSDEVQQFFFYLFIFSFLFIFFRFIMKSLL